MFYGGNFFFVYIIVYHLLFLYIDYLDIYKRSILLELVTIIVVYVFYQAYIKLYAASSDGYYLVLWVDGILLQLVMNAITMFIYGFQFGQFVSFGEKFAHLNFVFEYLFKNNFCILVMTKCILLFSLVELKNAHRIYVNFEKKPSMNIRKYYGMILMLIVAKLIIALYFIVINPTNAELVDGASQSYRMIMVQYDYIMYSPVSSIVSSIFSFMVYYMVSRYYTPKQTYTTPEKEIFDLLLLDFCRLQNFCIFIVDWKHFVVSYYVFFGVYSLFMFITYNRKSNSLLPDYIGDEKSHHL